MNRSVKITSASEGTVRPAVSLTVEDMRLPPSEWVPNHPHLPVLIYRDAVEGGDLATLFEERFAGNGWGGIWRDGIFDYQHYHTGAHEVLGIAEGRARVQIGGLSGPLIDVAAGDCLVLPAGTGHMRVEASRDFLVVGAYPPGQEADIQTGPASEPQLDKIARLPLPETDPLEGRDGPLLRYWRHER
jgi:uncharacterized protein YjlB